MQFVIDANILISAFLKSAVTRDLLTDENIELFALEYFRQEIGRIFKKASFKKRIKLNQEEIEEMEKKKEYDGQFNIVFEAIKKLLTAPPVDRAKFDTI